MNSAPSLALRLAPLLALICVIAVNAAANILPINDLRTGQISAMYPTGFTPANWVFRIWSLIYIGLLVYSLTALFGSAALRARAAAITPWFLINAAANICWIFAWHYQFIGVSMILTGIMLLSLLVITSKLRGRPARWTGRALIDAPFSLYFGWTTTATLANLANWFYDRQSWPFALGMDEWALVTVMIATVVYVWVSTVTRDLIYGAVFLWVAAGIYLRPDGIVESVQLAAAAGGVLVGLILIATLLRGRAGGGH